MPRIIVADALRLYDLGTTHAEDPSRTTAHDIEHDIDDLADRFLRSLGRRGGLGVSVAERSRADALGQPGLHQHAMSDRFLVYVLSWNIRIEEDLVDQPFNSSKRRLARTLLRLARYGKQDQAVKAIPSISQEMLAEMVGTTRSRVNFFMKQFQRQEFIDDKDRRQGCAQGQQLAAHRRLAR